MIRQCLVIFGFLAIGEMIVKFTGIKIPSSIIGMILLTISLKMEWVKLEWTKDIANFLVNLLGLFFVPAGVALMMYFELIQFHFWQITISVIGSTIITLVITGWTHQFLRLKTKK